MDLDAARTELEQAVREAEGEIAVLTLEAEEADEEGQLDEGDEASDLTENDREEALVEAVEVRLAEAKAALERIDAGTYGACVDCGQQIPAERLQFRPEASRCLACQERFEDTEG